VNDQWAELKWTNILHLASCELLGGRLVPPSSPSASLARTRQFIENKTWSTTMNGLNSQGREGNEKEESQTHIGRAKTLPANA
jgi:hypothetical protein